MNESRIDIIGQNGNDGEHYAELVDELCQPLIERLEPIANEAILTGTSTIEVTMIEAEKVYKELSHVKPSEVLRQGAQHMEDRAATYDKPEGERSMAATVNAFNAITGHEVSEEQGWMFMSLLKLVRSQQGDFKLDNYEDGAAYVALMAEAGSEARSAN